jgi:cell division septation protein DedD
MGPSSQVADRSARVEPQRTDGDPTATDMPAPDTNRANDTSTDDDRTDIDGAKAATTLDAEPAAGPAQPGRFAIQVAAYDRQAQAAALADRLTEQSYPSYVARSTDLEGRILFRVRIGAYPDRRAAEEAGQRVTADEGLEWYVVQAP